MLVNLAILLVLDLGLGLVLARRLGTAEAEDKRHPLLGFRVNPGTERRVRHAEHPDGGYVLRYNEQALRADHEYAVESGAPRIVIIGDSHTVGPMTLDESYPARTEAMLLEAGPVEVINGGHSRYSPYQAYLRLEHELVGFSPDQVVVAIYTGNDFLDLLRSDDRPWLEIQSGEPLPRPPHYLLYTPVPFPTWLDHSLAFQVYRRHVRPRLARVALTSELVQAWGGERADALRLLQQFREIGHKGAISQSLFQTAIFTRYPEAEAAALTLMKHVLDLHLRLAALHDYQVRLLIIPSRAQVEPHRDSELWNAALRTLGLGTDHGIGTVDTRLSESLLEMASERGIPTIDPRPALRALGESTAVYWRRDYHINVDGCRVLAELLARSLASVSPAVPAAAPTLASR